jgi:uncharacterized membrane protein YgcG
MAVDPESIRKAVAEVKLQTGSTEMSLEDLALATTRLGSLMLDVGQRTWVMYYAAKAGNWRFTQSQYREIGELMQVASLLRPDYAQHFETFLNEGWAQLGKAIEATDFAAFDPAFVEAVAQVNAYHEATHRAYIRWMLPAMPPAFLDLEPHEEDRTLSGWSRGGGGGGGGGGGTGQGGGRGGGGGGRGQGGGPGGRPH